MGSSAIFLSLNESKNSMISAAVPVLGERVYEQDFLCWLRFCVATDSYSFPTASHSHSGKISFEPFSEVYFPTHRCKPATIDSAGRA